MKRFIEKNIHFRLTLTQSKGCSLCGAWLTHYLKKKCPQKIDQLPTTDNTTIVELNFFGPFSIFKRDLKPTMIVFILFLQMPIFNYAFYC